MSGPLADMLGPLGMLAGQSEFFFSKSLLQVITDRWFGCRRPRGSLVSGASTLRRRLSGGVANAQAGEALEGGVGLLGALFG